MPATLTLMNLIENLRRVPKHYRRSSVCEPLEARIAPATFTWINPASGAWTTPANWSVVGVDADGIPDADDDVTINPATVGLVVTVSSGAQAANTITVPGDDVLQITGGSLTIGAVSSVANLTMTNGTLTANGPLTLTGSSSMSNGSFTGTFTNQGSLSFTGAAGKGLTNATLDNTGTITVAGENFDLNNSTVNNLATGVVDIQTNGNAIRQFGAMAVINNEGTFRKSAGAGAANIGAADFNNAAGGIVEVTSGQLSFGGGGTSTGGTFNIGAGAILDVTAGSDHTWTGSYTGSGLGLVRLSSGSIIAGGPGVTLNFPAGYFEITNASFTGGTFVNTGHITLTGNAGKGLTNATLDNTGTITVAGQNFDVNNSTLNNLAGGVVDIQTDGNAIRQFGAGAAVNNAGIFRKSAGAGSANIGAADFNNAAGGIVEVTAGQLTFGGGGTSLGGTFNVGAGAMLDVTAGTAHTWTGNYTGSGLGLVRLSTGSITAGGAGVTLNFPAGYFDITSASLDGGTFTNTGHITLTGGAGKGLTNATLNNSGTVTVAGQNFDLNNSTLNNLATGVVDIQTNGNAIRQFGAMAVINNAGLFRKSAGGDANIGAADFNNAAGGIVEVTSATFSLTGGGTNLGGTFNVGTGATLDVTAGSAHTWTGNYTGSGLGLVRLSSGSVTAGLGGVTLNFPTGYFDITSASLDGGTFTNTGHITMTGSAGKGLTNATLNNSGTVTVAGQNFDLNNSTLNNLGTGVVDIQTDGNAIRQFGAMAVINNAGVFRKSAGGGSANIGAADFNNATIGIVEVTAGQLGFGGGGTSLGGLFNVGAGAMLDVTAGSAHTWTGNYTGSGLGLVRLSTGSITAGGAGVTLNFPTGYFDITSGDLVGGTFTNTGHITMEGSAGKGLTNTTLNNSGTVTIAGPNFDLNNSTLNNAAGAIVDIQTDGNAIRQFGAMAVINNAGIFRKSAGGGSANIGAADFNNAAGGIVEVTAGQLTFGGSGTSLGGTFNVGAGATLDVTAGSVHTWTGTYTGSGDGRLLLSTGSINAGAAGVTLDFPAGYFDITSGALVGGTFTNTGHITMEGSAGKGLTNATLNNSGTVTVAGQNFDLNNSTLNNLVGGIVDIQTDGNVIRQFGAGAAVNNAGIFRKSVGAGSANIGAADFNNTDIGIVEVTSGQFSLSGGGTSKGGTFNVGAGAILNLTGGSSHIWTGLYTGTGAGKVELTGGSITAGTDGASLNFPAGYFDMSGGSLTGGTFTNAGHITMIGGAGKGLTNATLNNTGTIAVTGQNFDLNNSTLNNLFGGSLDIQTDGNALRRFGASATLNNDGLLQRTTGTGSANIGNVQLNNAGTVEVASGSFSIGSLPQLTGPANGSTLNGGVWIVRDGTTLDLPGSGIASNFATIILDGTGSMPDLAALSLNAGSLTLLGGKDLTRTGAFQNTGTLTLGPGSVYTINGGFTQSADGRFVLELGGSPVSGQFGFVAVSGVATLGGTLAIPSVNGFAPVQGDSFALMTYASRTGTFATFESGGETFAPVFELLTNPGEIRINSLIAAADLAITSATVPAGGNLGGEITITYTVENLQNRPTTVDDWADTIYFSRDEFLDESDFIFARIQHTGGLGPLGTYTENITRRVPGLPEGDYYVIIAADNRRVMPDLDRTNNDFLSAGTVGVTITTLPFGVPVNGTIVEGQDFFFKMTLPSGPDVFVTADFELPNAAEFYVRKGAVPDRVNFDLKASNLADLDKQLRLLNPRAGEYFILLHGREGALPESDFTIVAESAPFVLDSIGQNFGANAGLVTVPLLGGGFTGTLDAELRPVGGGDAIEAQSIRVVDSFNAFATFDLTGIAPGDFSIAALQGGAERIIADSFDVVAGETGRFEARLIVPSFVRQTRPFQVTVEYENRGGTDIEVPLLILDAAANNFVWAADEAQSRMTPKLQFLAANPDGYSGGVLRPGEKYSVTFNAITNSNSAKFTLSSTGGDSTEAVDFDQLEATLLPDSNPTLFGAAFDEVRADLGTNYGDLIDDLAAAADEARALGVELTTLPRIFGFLVDRELLTLPNANVRGIVFDGDVLHDAGRQALFLRDTTTEAIFETFSFYDGAFGFLDVPAGIYELSIDGFASDSVDTITVPASGVLSGVNPIGDPGQVLSGRLTNSTGSPLNGAIVTVTDSLGNEVSATTDRNGSYRITGLAPGSATLDARALGVTPLNDVVLNIATNAPAIGDFALGNGGIATGRVLGITGTPLANATLVATLADGSFSQTVTTDFFGRFRAGGLLPGTYTLAATATGFGPALIGGVLIGDGATTPVSDISLTTPGRLFGTITDAATGQPIAAVEAALADAFVAFEPVTSSATGNYEITDLGSGSITVFFSAPGYIRTAVTVSLATGEQGQTDVSLRPLGKIVGIASAGGSPAPGATIRLLQTSGDAGTGSIVTTAGADGSFLFTDLPDGDYVIAIGEGGGLAFGRQEVNLSSSDNDVTVNLDGTGTPLRGLVKDGGGAALAGRIVTLVQNGVPIASSTTDADGSYAFFIQQPGVFDVVTSGVSTGIIGHTGVDVTGGPVDLPDLAAGTVTLNLDVSSSAAGNPALAGSEVVLRRTDAAGFGERVLITGTDALGEAVFQNLTPGTYELFVIKDGFATETRTVVLGAAATEAFTLDPSAAITGTVRGPDGTPLPNVVVNFIAPTGDVFSVVTGSDGTYAQTNIAAGNYTVAATAANLTPFVTSVLDFANSAPVFDITLSDGGTALTGVLTDVNGTPLTGGTIIIANAAGVPILHTISDTAGTYAFTDVPAGAHTLLAGAAGYAPVSTPFNATGSGTLAQNAQLGQLLAGVAGTGASSSPAPAPAPLLVKSPSFGTFAGRDGIEAAPFSAFGVQPPAPLGQDGTSYRFDVGQVSVDPDCPDAIHARDAAVVSGVILDDAYKGWEAKYKDLVTLNSADLNLIAVRASEFGLKTLSFASGIETGIKNLIALSSETGLAAAGAIGTNGSKLLTILGDLGSAAKSFSMIGVRSQLAAFKTVAAEFFAGVGQIHSVTTGIPGTMLNIMGSLTGFEDLLDANADLFEGGNAGRVADYENAQEFYLNALQRHQKNLNEFNAAMANGKKGKGTPSENPEDPEEQKPEDEEEVPSVGSRDPNDIIGPAGFGAQNWIAADSLLAYTIRFENVATATAPAQEVFITQPLDNNLDPSSFQIGDFGFAGMIVDVPKGADFYTTRLDLRDTLGFFVDFEGSLNVNTGVASWTFRTIDPVTLDLPGDPFAGFLPPNLFSPEGEGFVSYSVKADALAPSGTVIDAQARIVFDLNDPIDTPAIFNTLDAEAPDSSVGALPGTTAAPRVVLDLTSGDGSGSGVHSVDIYVSVNGEPFTLFINDFAGDSISFRGENGNTYGFATVAKDNVGLTESLPLVADSTTTVSFTAQPFSKSQKLVFTDTDGDIYTIKLSGKGTGGLILDDPDGDGKGAIDRITLDGSDTKSKLSVTVKKNKNGGDGIVTIGDVTITGSLNSFTAKQSDLVIGGFSSTGPAKSLTIRDLLSTEPHLATAAITLGGTNVDKTAITARTIADGFALSTPGILTSLKAGSIGDGTITAAALGKLQTKAGGIGADITTPGAIGSIKIKGGDLVGDLLARSFGKIQIGGDFTGTLTSLAADLGKTAAVKSLAITGGDFTGDVRLLGGIGGVTVKAAPKNGPGGSILGGTLSAAKIGNLSIATNLDDARILAGADLGDDGAPGGANDTFAPGSIGKITVGGEIIASIIAAGLSTTDDILGNGDDTILGGVASVIAGITVKGAADNDSLFGAGRFKGAPKIAGAKIDPTTDARFLVV